MRLLTAGATRRVLLTKRWAFKIPLAHPHCSTSPWKTFAKRLFRGCLANINEQEFTVLQRVAPELDITFCPVVFHLPFGLLNVMPRCEPLTRDEYFSIYEDLEKYLPDVVELKLDSFGKLKGRIVVVDYG